jgi:multiple sugar transport system permease protein
VMIYPVVWMVMGSFKNNTEILNGIALFPASFHMTNYVNGWKGFGRITFATFFANSFYITILSTIGTTISSALVAYAFCRIPFKGKKIWFTCMLSTLMLPSQLVLIPQYIIFMKLHMINTYVPLVLPHFLGQAFFIYMMMQFMEGIPKELDEAAFIDGCSKYSIFTRIFSHCSLPPLSQL